VNLLDFLFLLLGSGLLVWVAVKMFGEYARAPKSRGVVGSSDLARGRALVVDGAEDTAGSPGQAGPPAGTVAAVASDVASDRTEDVRLAAKAAGVSSVFANLPARQPLWNRLRRGPEQDRS
jgi:hypothetical protein